MRSDQELNSLKRGLRALASINQSGSITIAQLARELDLPRSSAERILHTLATEGYIERFPSDKVFHLKSKVRGLASGFSEERWIVDVATPLLFQMTDKIGWPVAIATPEYYSMAVRVTTDPATALWLNRRRVGSSIPISTSSSGHAYLAFAKPAERAILLDLLSKPDVPDPFRIGDVPAMLATCERIRRAGYALNPIPGREESVSVPIMVEGSIKGILLMMFMSRALDTQKAVEMFLPQLLNLADKIGADVRSA